MKSLTIFALAGALVCPTAIRAEEGRIDQVERLEIEAGETELEAQIIRTWREDGWVANLTFEHGLKDGLQLGVEIESETREDGVLAVEAVEGQVKFTALDPRDAVVGLGAQIALVLDLDTGGLGYETRFIAEHQAESWSLTANIVAEAEPNEWSNPEFTYAARWDVDLAADFRGGVEVGGGLSGEGKGSHAFGPVVEVQPFEGGPAFEVALFLPLTEETPDLQFRLEIDLEI